MSVTYLELVCPAGTPAALRAAIDAGADTVYCGFRTPPTRATTPGSISTARRWPRAIGFAHARGRKVLVAINTFPRAGRDRDLAPRGRRRRRAGRRRGDPGRYRRAGLRQPRRHPELRLHLSVQAAASNPLSLDFYRENFGIRRVVLPRVLTVREIAALVARMRVETEVLRLRQPVPDGRGTLLAVVLRHRPVAEQRRRLLAGRACRLRRGGRQIAVAGSASSTINASSRRAGRLPDAVQGPLRRRDGERVLPVRGAGRPQRRRHPAAS